MASLMDDIMETARNFTANMQENAGLTLDYSAGSLREVDELLEAFRQEDLDEEALFNISSMVGCYVFETARRCHGGEYFWIEEEQQPILAAGLPEFSVGPAGQRGGGRHSFLHLRLSGSHQKGRKGRSCDHCLTELFS